MAHMTADTLFRTLIEEPLEAITSKTLLHVSYWLLDFERPEFSVEAPNMSGLYAVSMVFTNRTLEIFPAWENQLRGVNAYHIQTRLVSQGKASSELVTGKSLMEIRADESTLWSKALTETLACVEVYGIRSNPHLVRFVFPSAKVVVAVGYSGEKPLIGDGDEILVFADKQWHKTEKTLPESWTKLWECSGTEG